MPREVVAKLDQAVESARDFASRILCDMISIPTVNPPGEHYKEFVDYAASVLKELGLDVSVIEVPRDVVRKYYPEHADHPRYNLIARLSKGSGRPVLHFNGHYDVVPPGSGWSFDPFKPVVRGGRVYGRGAADMKGGIASILLAAKALVEVDPEFEGTFEISLTPDEETGGYTGVQYILEQGLVNPDYAVVAEPSGVDNVWIGCKGAVWAYVEVKGKQAHGSTPWLGRNAFEGMVEIAHRMVKELKPKVESKVSKYEYMDPEGAKATINIGGEVKGGAKVNIVPGYYAFSIDRRVIPEETAEEAAREIVEFVEHVAKELEGLEVSVRIVSKFDAAVTDPSQPLVREAKRAIREVLGREPRATVCVGGLDTRYFQWRGVQAVTYGPGDPAVAHAADEYVPLDNVVAVAKVYCRLVSSLLKARGG